MSAYCVYCCASPLFLSSVLMAHLNKALDVSSERSLLSSAGLANANADAKEDSVSNAQRTRKRDRKEHRVIAFVLSVVDDDGQVTHSVLSLAFTRVSDAYT